MSKENLSEVTLPTNKRKIETNSWNEDEFLEEVDAEFAIQFTNRYFRQTQGVRRRMSMG